MFLKKLLILLGALFLIFIVVIFSIFISLSNFIKGEKFKDLVSQRIFQTTGIKVESSNFIWNGNKVYIRNIKSKFNQENNYFDLFIGGVNFEIDVSSIYRERVWKINNISVNRVELKAENNSKKGFDVDSIESDFKTQNESKKAWYEKYLPNKVVFNEGSIDKFTLLYFDKDSQNIKADDFRLILKPLESNLGVFITSKSGVINFNKFPEIKVNDFSARVTPTAYEIIKLKGITKGGGVVNLNLDAFKNGDKNEFSFALKSFYDDVKIENIINANWVKKVKGKINGKHHLTSDDGVSLKNSSGSINANGVILEAFPILEQVSKYTQSSKFRRLIFHKAQANYKSKNETINLTDVLLESLGLLRIEGNISIDGEELDGEFNLGVTPGILTSIPSIEQNIFKDGQRDGFAWTKVKINGTLKNPQNDLKSRIRDAILMMPVHIIEKMGYKAFDGGKRVILDNGLEFIRGENGFEENTNDKKESREIVKKGIDKSKKVMKTGVDVMKTGAKGASGLIKSTSDTLTKGIKSFLD